MSHTDSEEKTKDDVYYERNLLAIGFIAAIRDAKDAVGLEVNCGWWPDTDDVNEEEWAVVWIDLGTGQVGWHVPEEMIPGWLPKKDPEYDGYTTEEKNDRIKKLLRIDMGAGDE